MEERIISAMQNHTPVNVRINVIFVWALNWEQKLKIIEMKSEKYYFEDEDASICYQRDHFVDIMKHDGISEIEVFEAIPEKSKEFFWCKYYGEAGERNDNSCGKSCEKYSPRNGKSGCCKHHTTRMYMWGEKITLRL